MMQTFLVPAPQPRRSHRRPPEEFDALDIFEGTIRGFIRIVKPFMTNELSRQPHIDAIREAGCAYRFKDGSFCGCKEGVWYCHNVSSEQETLVEDLAMQYLMPNANGEGQYICRVPIREALAKFLAMHGTLEKALELGRPLCREHDTDGRRQPRLQLSPT